jgi:hypothetical protein
VKYTNNAIGARGINLKDGTTVWVDPGETTDDLAKADIADVHADLTEGDKPLGELSKAELEEIAEREGVDLTAAKNNDERVAAIEAARAV